MSAVAQPTGEYGPAHARRETYQRGDGNLTTYSYTNGRLMGQTDPAGTYAFRLRPLRPAELDHPVTIR